MKTTLVSRIMRLSMIISAVVGVCMTAIAAVWIYDTALSDSTEFADYIVTVCENTITEEFRYLSESILMAAPSEDGDATFDEVFVYGSESGYDYSKFDAYADSLEAGDTYICEPVTDENGEPVYLVIGRLQDGTVLAGELSYEYFVAITESLSVYEDDRSYVLKNDGGIYLSTDYEELASGAELPEEIFALISADNADAEGSETEKSKLGGENKLITFKGIDYGFTIVYCTDYSRVVADFTTLVIVLPLVLLLIQAAIYFFSRFAAGRIAQPISVTTERLRLLAQGDTHTPFTPNSKGDETQVLSEAMAETIR